MGHIEEIAVFRLDCDCFRGNWHVKYTKTRTDCCKLCLVISVNCSKFKVRNYELDMQHRLECIKSRQTGIQCPSDTPPYSA